jgi:LPXTG-motif cell wall-anchored protein
MLQEVGKMTFLRDKVRASCALVAIITLNTLPVAEPAVAQGGVTPSFGDGKLTVVGEGYRAGEQVEITVRVGGVGHQFTATADTRGRFRLETGLQVPPMSSVEIEARDEQGLTQATMTSAPGALTGPGGGMPLPVAPSPPVRTPTQLPRTGESGHQLLMGAGLASVLILGGLLLRGRSHHPR